MKYMCRKCGGSDPCFIDWTDAPAPEYCPCDGEEVIWRKVSEPAALPKLTAEDPDWLKLGAWAAVGQFVGKVDWISRDASECRITCGESLFAKTGEVKAVTWRAWNDDEMRQQVGKIFKSKNLGHSLLATEWRSDGEKPYLFLGHGSTFGREAKSMLQNYEQLSGLPCGIPQCEGKDLEG